MFMLGPCARPGQVWRLTVPGRGLFVGVSYSQGRGLVKTFRTDPQPDRPTVCSSHDSSRVRSYQEVPTSISCGEAITRRRKDDRRVDHASWPSRSNCRHPKLGMNTIISSTGSCYVTSGKYRLLQHFRPSPVSIAWHDPEAECSSPDSCEGGSEEKICPRIGQSVTVMGQDKAILILFVLASEDVSLMSGIRPSFWTLSIMRGNNA